MRINFSTGLFFLTNKKKILKELKLNFFKKFYINLNNIVFNWLIKLNKKN